MKKFLKKLFSALPVSVPIKGSDEISDLADALEHMRTALIDKENSEMQMKQAQDNLVLGMAHDLRTPLTSLMAYIEIVKRQNEHDEVVKYSDKALQKADEIKNLSDQLFDFFLIDSREKEEFEIISIQNAFMIIIAIQLIFFYYQNDQRFCQAELI